MTLLFSWPLAMNAQFPCTPVAHYPLNGDALDASGNGLHGVVDGPTPATDRYGFPGMALHFDGVNDRILLPSDFDVPERTWAFWFKAEEITTTFREIYDVDHPALQHAQTEVFLVQEGGVDKMKMNMGSANTLYVQTVSEGVWYHVAQVRSATDVRFYVNGCLVFTSGDLANVHSAQGQPTACLGTGRLHNNYWFKGDLDGVLVFDCALSAAQIAELAEDDCGGPGGGLCPVLAHYPMDGDATDLSWNGFNGVVVGCTPTADRNGIPDAALAFDGMDDAVDLPVDYDVPERTWAFWCRPDEIDPGFREVFDADHNGIEHAQTEIFFVEEGGQDLVKMNMGSANTLYVQPVTEGTWYHFAMVRSTVDVRFYINGCLVHTSSDLGNVHSSAGQPTIRLGTGRFHNEYWFSGALDDVLVHGCALNAAQVEQISGGCSAVVPDAVYSGGTLRAVPLGDGRFRLDTGEAGSWELRIFGPDGRLVESRQGSGQVVLNTARWSSGAYQLVVLSDHGARTARLVAGAGFP